jgi:hypothetical protein
MKLLPDFKANLSALLRTPPPPKGETLQHGGAKSKGAEGGEEQVRRVAAAVPGDAEQIVLALESRFTSRSYVTSATSIGSGVPRYVAELWRMHKGDDVAVCAVWMHPDGAELRLIVNGEIKQTDATPHVFALSTVALAWKERWHCMKGWR